MKKSFHAHSQYSSHIHGRIQKRRSFGFIPTSALLEASRRFWDILPKRREFWTRVPEVGVSFSRPFKLICVAESINTINAKKCACCECFCVYTVF